MFTALRKAAFCENPGELVAAIWVLLLFSPSKYLQKNAPAVRQTIFVQSWQKNSKAFLLRKFFEYRLDLFEWRTLLKRKAQRRQAIWIHLWRVVIKEGIVIWKSQIVRNAPLDKHVWFMCLLVDYLSCKVVRIVRKNQRNNLGKGKLAI